MARSNNTFIKKQKAKDRTDKRLEKLDKKHDKKKEVDAGTLKNMMAYVDKFGNITSEPPEKEKVNTQ